MLICVDILLLSQRIWIAKYWLESPRRDGNPGSQDWEQKGFAFLAMRSASRNRLNHMVHSPGLG